MNKSVLQKKYQQCLAEMREKSDLADKLYWGKITIDAVPTAWREEVQEMVNARIERNGTADEQELSAADALEIILGGNV